VKSLWPAWTGTPLARVMVGLLGAAVFGTGVAAVFTTENGTGAAALLAIGAGFVVIAALGDQLESVEFGGVSVTLRDIARETLDLADRVEQGGDPGAARSLRAVGEALQELADEYRRLRSAMRAGPERTQALELVIDRARRLAGVAPLEPSDVSAWFTQGTPEARVTALGLMQGSPRLHDFDAALDAIDQPRSAFEQYHGLVLALDMVGSLSQGRRAQLRQAVKRVLRGWRSRRDSDRRTVATEILRELGE
jgi:hypothetical protein